MLCVFFIVCWLTSSKNAGYFSNTARCSTSLGFLAYLGQQLTPTTPFVTHLATGSCRWILKLWPKKIKTEPDHPWHSQYLAGWTDWVKNSIRFFKFEQVFYKKLTCDLKAFWNSRIGRFLDNLLNNFCLFNLALVYSYFCGYIATAVILCLCWRCAVWYMSK